MTVYFDNLFSKPDHHSEDEEEFGERFPRENQTSVRSVAHLVYGERLLPYQNSGFSFQHLSYDEVPELY